MKRCFAIVLSALLMMACVPSVSAEYNDDQFDWGEHACPHTHVEKVASVESTCLAQGHAAYTVCVDCRLVVEGSREPLPPADHTYDNACDTDCNVCGEGRDVAHDYAVRVVEPTCTEKGQKEYTCIHCGDNYSETLPAKGHNYESVVVTEATCATAGLRKEICTACGDTQEKVISATGNHRYDGEGGTCMTCGKECPPFLLGDTNRDGRVNNRDLGLLQMYLNDGDLTDKLFDETTADLDGNGKVNNRDLGLLLKVLNQ